MFQDNEIIIKNLKGVAKIIAEKCDHNGDNLLKKTKDYDEKAYSATHFQLLMIIIHLFSVEKHTTLMGA